MFPPAFKCLPSHTPCSHPLYHRASPACAAFLCVRCPLVGQRGRTMSTAGIDWVGEAGDGTIEEVAFSVCAPDSDDESRREPESVAVMGGGGGGEGGGEGGSGYTGGGCG